MANGDVELTRASEEPTPEGLPPALPAMPVPASLFEELPEGNDGTEESLALLLDRAHPFD